MAEFIRISVYRTLEGLSCHVEHMLGEMPRPKVMRRREFTYKAEWGTPSWGVALRWAAQVLASESARLSGPPVPGRRAPAPPGGSRGETLNLDLNP